MATPLLKPVALFQDLRRTAATMLHEAGFDGDHHGHLRFGVFTMPKRYIQQSVKRTQEVGKTMHFLKQKEVRGTDPKTARPA